MGKTRDLLLILIAGTILNSACRLPPPITGDPDSTKPEVKLTSVFLSPELDAGEDTPWLGVHLADTSTQSPLILATADDPESGVQKVWIEGGTRVWCTTQDGEPSVVLRSSPLSAETSGSAGSSSRLAVQLSLPSRTQLRGICERDGFALRDFQIDLYARAMNGAGEETRLRGHSVIQGPSNLRVLVYNMHMAWECDKIEPVVDLLRPLFQSADIVLLQEAGPCVEAWKRDLLDPSYSGVHFADLIVFGRWPIRKSRPLANPPGVFDDGDVRATVQSNALWVQFDAGGYLIEVIDNHWDHRPAPPDPFQPCTEWRPSARRLAFAEQIHDEVAARVDVWTPLFIGGDFNASSPWEGQPLGSGEIAHLGSWLRNAMVDVDGRCYRCIDALYVRGPWRTARITGESPKYPAGGDFSDHGMLLFDMTRQQELTTPAVPKPACENNPARCPDSPCP